MNGTDSRTRRVIVSSKNPVKIAATEATFKAMLPEAQLVFDGVSVSSGVSDQPMSDDETLQGARNRVKNARTKCSDADFWVGIEGGLERTREGGMNSFAWMVIQSAEGLITSSRTATCPMPDKVAELIEQGIELGDADDIVFGHSNSKQKHGTAGILTGDAITRTSFYREALIFALVPYKNSGLAFS